MNDQQKGSAKLIKLAVILAICGVIATAVMLLPKGFKNDLTLIGQGSPSVVLVHDKNLVGGTTTMALLNKVRPDYKGKVVFLAVDIVTPTGQAFMQEQAVRAIDIVVFGPDGSRQQVLKGGVNEQELRSTLDATIKQ